MNSRSVQRLRLTSPLPARLGRDSARVLNLSLRGALVRGPLARRSGERVALTLEETPPIILESRVTRCEVGEFVGGAIHYDIAVVWHHPDLEALSRVRQLLVDVLMREIAEWEQNATGGNPSVESFPGFDFDPASLSASVASSKSILRWHRLIGGKWHATNVSSSVQPFDGFCVTSLVEPDEIELLRRSYERADEPGRRLIRHLATLASVEHHDDGRRHK